MIITRPISFYKKGGGFALDGLTDLPVAAWSTRRLFKAFTGDVVRIRRSSDNAESDIGTDEVGDLDTASISSFIGGGFGFLVRMYDQIRAGQFLSQSVAADQPLYDASPASFPKPGFELRDVTDYLGEADIPVGNAPLTVYATVHPLTVTPNRVFWGIGTITAGGYYSMLHATGGGLVTFRAGTNASTANTDTSASIGTGSTRVIEGRELSTSERYVRMDGANEGSNLGSITINVDTADHRLGEAPSIQNLPLDGFFPELLIFDKDLSLADRNIATSAAEYWGATVSTIT